MVTAALLVSVLAGLATALALRARSPRLGSASAPMAQAHGDRLTAVDASFLAQEGPNSHMHVGAVTVFEGPPPAFRASRSTCAGGCTSSPRYRQKLAFPPLETGRPLWVDDPNFNLEYHLRHTALPAPGSEDQLRALAARIHSQQLDRNKPLWELWLVEGLEDGRFALISKTHHALVDGVAGVDLATVLFDLEPVPPALPHEGEPWMPQPDRAPPRWPRAGSAGWPAAARARRPGGRRRVAPGGGAARRARGRRGRRRDRVGGPEPGARHAAQRADRPPPAARVRPLRAGGLQGRSRTRSAARSTTSCSTVVAGALRRWLQSRGVRTEGLELRALVPVSIRGADERGHMGNRLAVMRGPLPVYIEDPVARLRVVRQAMDGLKESKQAVGAEMLTGVQKFAPPTVLAQASRMNFSTRLFNLIVTNVPGPQFPLYVLGRELLDLFPIAFLPNNHALAVAIMSYNGGIDFGLLGDYDAMPDLDELAVMLDETRDEVLADWRRRPRRTASGLVAQGELRVLGHLLRRPRGREDHVRHDLGHAGELAHELHHLLGDLRTDRAGGRREREHDVHGAPRRSRRRRRGRARRSRDRARGR